MKNKFNLSKLLPFPCFPAVISHLMAAFAPLFLRTRYSLLTLFFTPSFNSDVKFAVSFVPFSFQTLPRRTPMSHAHGIRGKNRLTLIAESSAKIKELTMIKNTTQTTLFIFSNFSLFSSGHDFRLWLMGEDSAN